MDSEATNPQKIPHFNQELPESKFGILLLSYPLIIKRLNLNLASKIARKSQIMIQEAPEVRRGIFEEWVHECVCVSAY